MPRTLDRDAVHRALGRALRASPGASAAELAVAVGVSPTTMSRLLAERNTELLVVGRARRTRYALRRRAPGLPDAVPVFEVRPTGEAPRHLVDLHLAAPEGVFSVSATSQEYTSGLPWFLDDLRPTGFLGRALGETDLWSADDVLRFACGHGWNLPGAFVLGELAYAEFTRAAAEPPDLVALDDRERRYVELAGGALGSGFGVGGEQPKFLATRGDGVPVLVKFSPPLTDPAAVRVGDLLIAEHVAHGVLASAGQPSARSEVLFAGGRVFLEIGRFDRQGTAHRRGVASLRAVDAQFVGGPLDRWSTTTAALVRDGLLAPADHRRVRWLEAFGHAIANTDMHPGNLSFWLDGVELAGVAPAYDMLPMAYAPRQRELVPVTFRPARPSPANADVADEVVAAAARFWAAVAAHPAVSSGFAGECRRNAERL